MLLILFSHREMEGNGAIDPATIGGEVRGGCKGRCKGTDSIHLHAFISFRSLNLLQVWENLSLFGRIFPSRPAERSFHSSFNQITPPPPHSHSGCYLLSETGSIYEILKREKKKNEMGKLEKNRTNNT